MSALNLPAIIAVVAAIVIVVGRVRREPDQARRNFHVAKPSLQNQEPLEPDPDKEDQEWSR